MSRRVLVFRLVPVVLALVAGPTTAAAAPPLPSEPYVVVLRDGSVAPLAPGPGSAAHRDALLRDEGVRANQRFDHVLSGFAAQLTAGQVRALERRPDVAWVEPDRLVGIAAPIVSPVPDRVEAEWSPAAAIDGGGAGVNADIAIVDTGIAAHPDLTVAGGYNCRTSDRTRWADDSGHGTHVAGIAAARDNGFGITGVAPGARVWGVKVLDSTGYGPVSSVVCGLDWVASKHDPADATRPLFEAVNLSLINPGSDDHACGSVNHDTRHAAICRVVSRGTVVVAAAGNNATNVVNWVPASYDEVITVSALADYDGVAGGFGSQPCTLLGSNDADDTFANFSNYGADVDLIAPGKCVRSTFLGGGYKVISGTSMAAPAVTGAVALYRSVHPRATPAEVRAALRAAGSLDWRTSTDPDGHPDPLLNVAEIGRDPDTVAPTVTPPSLVLRSGTSVTSVGAVPVRAAWSGKDDWAISRYELQRGATGGTLAAVRLTSRTARSADTSLVAGRSWTHRVRAVDPAANSSGWAGAARTVTAYQSTSAGISFGGRWTTVYNTADYGGGRRSSATAGSTATLAFTGSSVGWVSVLGPGHGKADVYVDGVKVATVDTYAASIVRRRVVWVRSLPAGSHTARIVVLGTPGRPTVDLDAWVTVR